MWDRPEDELLGEAKLLARHVEGNMNALNVATRQLLDNSDSSVNLLISALLATGLSAIVSHETGLPNHGDAIREVLS